MKASGSALDETIPGQRSIEEQVSVNLPVLLLLRPNHSVSNTEGQPHATAFPVRPTKTNQESTEQRSQRLAYLLRLTCLFCS